MQTSCQGLIGALEDKEGHVEEVESDESEEEELEESKESEEELEAAPEVEEEEGAPLKLEHVVKSEGTPRSSFFQPHNTLSQTQQRATSAPAASWARDSRVQTVEVDVTWSTK